MHEYEDYRYGRLIKKQNIKMIIKILPIIIINQDTVKTLQYSKYLWHIQILPPSLPCMPNLLCNFT